MPIAKLPIVAALAVLALVSASPARAQAPAPTGTGGAAFGEVGPTGLDVAPGALLGGTLQVSGTVAAAAGGPVRVEDLDPRTRTWTAVARVAAGPQGDFTAQWTPSAPGQFVLRAVPDVAATSPAQAAASAPTAQTTVYRPARATWYGPGFWGRRTACGVRLGRATLGVAHRRLPCGTPVSLYYGGRQVAVPVIDRGPFANNASLDLTQAAARQLGMTETSQIGWVPIAAPVPAPAPATAG